jgi:CheY-like chemotaxis protein
MMGGDISIRSRAGVGSTFAFSVCLNTLEGETATSLARVEIQEETLDFSNKKVLLVEDNEINQELVVELLKDTGMSIDIANNGLEALERVKLQAYDLVFMDIQMPFLDGFEVTRRIRKDIGKKELPIIAMTANASNEDRENCIQSGMDDFVSKPIAPASLFKVLSTWLNTTSDVTADAASALAALKPPVQEELPFDRTKALQMMGGKEALLEKMLYMFKDRFSNSVAELQSLLEAADYDTAQRLAHTLKGVSANIAADIVKVCADRIETRLKHYSRNELSPPDLSEDVKLLSVAMTDLLLYLDRHPPAPKSTKAS